MESVLEKDKKWQEFLSLIRRKIELQSAKKDYKENTFSLKYKQLLDIFGEKDEIKEYLEYAEKVKGIIKLESISKQKTKDEKLSDFAFKNEKTPTNILLTGKDFFMPERYININYYSEDIFIFEYDYDKFIAPLQKKEEYSQMSADSLKKILKILDMLKTEYDLNSTTITEDQYWDWVRKCGLSSFPQLQGILTTLKEEDLILDFKVITEAM